MKILLLDSNIVNYVEMPLIEQDILGHDYHVAWLPHLDLSRDKEMLATADGIIAFAGVKIDKDLLNHLNKCKAIVMATHDFESIDLKSATERGIFISNVPDMAINEIVDHTFAFILSAQRKLLLLQDAVNQDNWNWRTAGEIYSSTNLTLGLVGFGKIAREVAARAKSFGYQVVYYDPHFFPYHSNTFASSVVSLAELLTRSDIVSLHLPLNEYTYHIINKKTLSLMKKTAVLINTSNSSLIEIAALLSALRKDEIAQVCLDVVDFGSKIPRLLKNNPRVLITPHVASCSKQSLFKLRVHATLALKSLLVLSQSQSSPVQLRNNAIHRRQQYAA